jgi:hypothetical protein
MFVYSLLKIFNEEDLNKDIKFSKLKPAQHFLKLLLFAFQPERNSIIPSSKFEIFMAKLDIMKRMFHYYSCNLYPDEKESMIKKFIFLNYSLMQFAQIRQMRNLF